MNYRGNGPYQLPRQAMVRETLASPKPLIFLAVAVLTGLMLLGHLGDLPLTSPDEARNAEVGREMHESGSWLIPTYNGLAYLDKPAFFFKLTALSIAVFGTTEFAARLVSALSGCALLALVFVFCHREYGFREALLSSIILTTTPLFVVFSHLVIFDMLLAFFITLAIICCYFAEASEQSPPQRRWYLLAAASVGLATLVKGPVGFIIPTLVVWLYSRLEGRRGALGRFLAPMNLLVFLALVLPWFIGVVYLHPDFAYYGLVKESLQRFTTSEFRRTAPFYYYFPVIFLALFPWSLLLPEAAVRFWRSRYPWKPADRLLIVWTLTVVGFFSFSQSKMPGYVLTAVVALAILSARVFANALAHSAGTAARTVWRGTIVLAIGYLLGGLAILYLGLNEHALTALGIEPGRVADIIEPPHAALVRLGSALVMASLIAVMALWRRDLRLSLAAFAAFMVQLIMVNLPVLESYADYRSHRALAYSLSNLPRTTALACLQCFPHGVPFYLGRTMTIISERGKELTSNYVLYTLEKTAVWPAGVIRVSEAERWLANRKHPVYLLAKQDDLPDLKALAGSEATTLDELPQGYRGMLIPSRTVKD
jgi:4-amino-4-deoxy-L-arabinose transferase-like glycosyltransferase